jgi:hypothetical protein
MTKFFLNLKNASHIYIHTHTHTHILRKKNNQKFLKKEKKNASQSPAAHRDPSYLGRRSWFEASPGKYS